jgi:hypothetical protein
MMGRPSNVDDFRRRRVTACSRGQLLSSQSVLACAMVTTRQAYTTALSPGAARALRVVSALWRAVHPMCSFFWSDNASPLDSSQALQNLLLHCSCRDRRSTAHRHGDLQLLVAPPPGRCSWANLREQHMQHFTPWALGLSIRQLAVNGAASRLHCSSPLPWYS